MVINVIMLDMYKGASPAPLAGVQAANEPRKRDEREVLK